VQESVPASIRVAATVRRARLNWGFGASAYGADAAPLVVRRRRVGVGRGQWYAPVVSRRRAYRIV
jgi:hypothetical protein